MHVIGAAQHLLIMEALGGDQSWDVRFLAQHSAVLYYWALVALFMISPSLGYLFSVLLEGVLQFGRYIQRCLLYTSPSPRDGLLSRMPSSA